uniref:Protein kinase domain-containing protein n=1 Tax=Oryza brachyantha TaxID=4533 RepID=J3N2Y6_ORYBR
MIDLCCVEIWKKHELELVLFGWREWTRTDRLPVTLVQSSGGVFSGEHVEGDAVLRFRGLGEGGAAGPVGGVRGGGDDAVAVGAVQQQHVDGPRRAAGGVGELKSATRGFSRSLVLGEGGFGCVYRGTIRSVLEPRRSVEVAIKQLGRKGLQGHKEWVTEVNVLGVVDHPNLVKLIGYCAEDDERGMQLLLVYEFMPNGSLADHLSSRSPRPASWAMRLRVALDTARGLKYLHEESEIKIIFRDLKPSNILIDENWNAKLSDFGLARLGPQEGSHVSTAVVGTIGYAAPEYIHTGRLSSKNDIWSYGVVLYELLTGRRPLDRNRPRGEQNLIEWVKPYSSDAKKLEIIMDPRLEGKYSLKSAAKLASVANKCLVRHARHRPKMSEVLEMVQKIIDSSDLGTPEHPLISKSKELVRDEKKRKGIDLKRRFADIKAGDQRWFTWQRWRPKLVRTQ